MSKIKKVHILYIVQPYYIGGAEIALANIIKHLDPAIFDHTVMFSAEGEAVRLFASHGIKTIIMPFGNWSNARKRLLEFMRDRGIDLVYTNTIRHFEAAMAARLAGIGHIWHMHCRLESVYPERKPAHIKKVLELIHFLSTRIIACSGFVKEQFLEASLNNRVSTINYGIDMNDFVCAPGSPEDDLPIGMVARIDPQKRPEDFIRAAARVKRKFPKVKFVLIGEGTSSEYVTHLRNINKENGDPVTMSGFSEDVPGIMRSLDLLVLPSVGDASPMVILEAMACKKPVIAAHSGGIPEIVINGKTGILIPPKKPLALAGAIEELVHDPGRARSMGLHGRKRVEKCYDIRRTVQEIRDLLLSSIKGKNGNNK